MQVSDIDQVANLYKIHFRPNSGFDLAEFRQYAEDVYFSRADYSEDLGCQVYEESDGRIGAAILCVPMQIRHGSQTYHGRLLNCFVKHPDSSSAGVWRILSKLRARYQDFTFSDTANDMSWRIAQGIGGVYLPVQSLKWRRMFRPGSFLAQKVSGVGSALSGAASVAGSVLLDQPARRIEKGLQVLADESVSSQPISLMDFRQLAQDMLERFTVRPEWDTTEFAWIADKVLKNPDLGEVTVRKVLDGNGKVLGAYVYFLGADRSANVFNILSADGNDADVVNELLAHLDSTGCVVASGMAQPFLMTAFAKQKYVDYRHRGHYYVMTRHEGVLKAIARNEIYMGGFASESWNRLLTGFKGPVPAKQAAA